MNHIAKWMPQSTKRGLTVWVCGEQMRRLVTVRRDTDGFRVIKPVWYVIRSGHAKELYADFQRIVTPAMAEFILGLEALSPCPQCVLEGRHHLAALQRVIDDHTFSIGKLRITGRGL